MGIDTAEVMFDFEKLDVYGQAEDAALAVIQSAQRWPLRLRLLRDQVVRSAFSVPLNIAEGNGRETHKDKGHFFRIAKGSLNETVAALNMASRLGVMDATVRLEIRARFFRVVQMLHGLIRKSDQGDKVL